MEQEEGGMRVGGGGDEEGGSAGCSFNWGLAFGSPFEAAGKRLEPQEATLFYGLQSNWRFRTKHGRKR